jgi:hypothetical protein
MAVTYTMEQAVKIANMAGRDAGNRSARAAGRTEWSAADYAAALAANDVALRAMGYRWLTGGE